MHVTYETEAEKEQRREFFNRVLFLKQMME